MITHLLFVALVLGVSAAVAATPWWTAFLAWGAILFTGANFWFGDQILGLFGDRLQDLTIGPNIGGRLTSAMNWIGTAIMHGAVMVVVAFVDLDAGWSIYGLWYIKMLLFGTIEFIGFFVWSRRIRY